MVNSTLSKSKKDLPEKKDKGNTPQNRIDFTGAVENATEKQIKAIERGLKKLQTKFPDTDFQLKIKK